MTDLDCAVIFPGQGAQRPGMGAPWLGSPHWRIVDEVSEWTGYPVGDLLLHTGDERLRRTDLAQISIFTMSLMAWNHLCANGIVTGVRACAGHSLGEYTALVAAGALTPREGALLVAARGAAMLAATRGHDGTMAAILGGEAADIERMAGAVRAEGGHVWVANLNGPRQVVVSGTEPGVAAVAEQARAARLKVVRLRVGGAFHTPLMAAAVPALRTALAAAEFRRTTVRIVADVDASVYSPRRWRRLAEQQLTAPVRWTDVLEALVDRLGCTRVVEVGPTRVLAKSLGRQRVPVRVGYCGYPGDLPVA
ncbi:ACP S-malonyltransferase [Nocardia sp. CDC159]|uniref:[acyl-carrier-protein] S-malonyltransferase n=1 Tax=Nocardia pulmonis TaxID=2951408 RepID=A0A9X2ECR5_9NOCA|nr:MULTISPECIES: ACP S-malonyltransferase [Nocardia]MCM6775621.1 ACP S-malonyltransferase [Nocardia pulmonis]MCM6787645.1 ACP S-malonyltransferase [Nocardia sp. CDC159]